MSLYDDLLALVPNKKQTPNGWVSFNAPCCAHQGENRDTKKRGGIKRTEDGGATYHCFNCGYKASWKPGRGLSKKMRELLGWMGASDDQINKITFECLRTKEEETNTSIIIPQFVPRELPKTAQKITEDLIVNDHRVIPVVEYMYSRGLTLDDGDFYWTEKMADRFIIPIILNKQIIGHVARRIHDTKPKYVKSHPPHIVFGLDKQTWNRKFILVFEGQIDALMLEGVSIMGNEVSPEQAVQINTLGKKVIVVPDQDTAGETLVKHALEYGWSVAFPNWADDIKDAADAVKRYGKLTTLITIVKNVEDNPLKIKLRMKL
jgi:hypothetical protein